MFGVLPQSGLQQGVDLCFSKLKAHFRIKLDKTLISMFYQEQVIRTS